MTVPTISAIIPLYNGARYIEQALQSVFNQTLPAHEIIVVNDGSTDNGPEIVERLSETHAVALLHQENLGQAAARNRAIRHASGSLIALLDQDDLWYPHHLQELVKPFLQSAYPPLGWVYSNLDEINADNQMIVRSALDACVTPHPKPSIFACIREDMFVLPSSSLMSRKAFLAVDGFDERLSGYEDDDLFLRLFHAGFDNQYIKQPLGQWRITNSSSSYSPRMARSRMVFARKLLDTFPDTPALARYHCRDMIAPRFLPQAITEVRRAMRGRDQDQVAICMDDVRLLRSHVAQRPPARADLLISVVIALYNGAPFIEQALRSVLAQTLEPDEIVVVDDGSTDNGPDLVLEMARHHPIRLLRKTNGGQSSARNHGVAHTHGDLIAFLDQDDVWYESHLDALVQPFTTPRSTVLGWTYSNLDQVDRAGNLVIRSFLGTLGTAHPKTQITQCLAQGMYVLPSASLISRKAFDNISGFDEALSGYEDDDLFLRLFRAGYDNIYLDTPLSQWRIYSDSTSFTPRMAASRMIYARKLIAAFPDNPQQGRFYARDYIAPRFAKHLLAEYRNAVIDGSEVQRQSAFDNLAYLADFLPQCVRVPLRAMLPLLRNRSIARLLFRIRGPVRGVARRILRFER